MNGELLLDMHCHMATTDCISEFELGAKLAGTFIVLHKCPTKAVER